MDLDGALAAMAYLGMRPEALCIADQMNRVVFASPAFCRLFGYSDYRDVVGCCIGDLVSPGIDHPHRTDMAPQMRGGDRTRFAIEGAVRGCKADGSAFDVIIGERQMFSVGNKIFMSCVARLPATG